mmetsp:Transcript_56998/g.90343  ORF Transcript_56998/g.90343 Transcript_56998/m.90343 type:complete len:255 (-) Transcript_56998:529-1293(-)
MALSRKTFTIRTSRIRRQKRSREVAKTSGMSAPASCMHTSASPLAASSRSKKFQGHSWPEKNCLQPWITTIRSRISAIKKKAKALSTASQPCQSAYSGSAWKPTTTPLEMMMKATKGSRNTPMLLSSGGAAKSLIRTKVNSATKRLVSPAKRISFMALNCFIYRLPKILLWISHSLARKTSINGLAGTMLNCLLTPANGSKVCCMEALRFRLRLFSGEGQCHTGVPLTSGTAGWWWLVKKNMFVEVTLVRRGFS